MLLFRSWCLVFSTHFSLSWRDYDKIHPRRLTTVQKQRATVAALDYRIVLTAEERVLWKRQDLRAGVVAGVILGPAVMPDDEWSGRFVRSESAPPDWSSPGTSHVWNIHARLSVAKYKRNSIRRTQRSRMYIYIYILVCVRSQEMWKIIAKTFNSSTFNNKIRT